MKFKSYLNSILRIYSSHFPANFIRLHSSERDLNFPEKLWEKFKKKINQDTIKFYPNIAGTYTKLKKFYKINKKFDLLLGDGSDRIIKYCFESFCEKNSEVISTSPCFPMYNVYSKLYETKIISYKINKPVLETNKIISNLNKKTSFIILSNPLSPYGFTIDEKNLETLAKNANKYGALLIVDEAYIEFSSQKSFLELSMKKNIKNVIIIKTFSKAFGSAGVRVGIGMAHKTLINRMKKFRTMHEISALSDAWINTIIDNYQYVTKYIKKVKKNKNKIFNELNNYENIEILDSESNWVFLRGKNSILKKKFQSNRIAVKSDILIPWTNIRKSWFKISIPAVDSNLNKLLKTIIK
tara:strand:- start:68 stop:1129 length:1062 start_codon:yes stop_codon:yes gene_type:complete